jgi:phthalate 4,5-dioxygenase oxygenase subunit
VHRHAQRAARSEDFKHKVHATAYRTAERNGLVWVYMGDRADPPPVPY